MADIRKIAETLLETDMKELQDIAKVLKEQYGVEAKSFGADVYAACCSQKRTPKNYGIELLNKRKRKRR